MSFLRKSPVEHCEDLFGAACGVGPHLSEWVRDAQNRVSHSLDFKTARMSFNSDSKSTRTAVPWWSNCSEVESGTFDATRKTECARAVVGLFHGARRTLCAFLDTA